jgi:hypothetical protein
MPTQTDQFPTGEAMAAQRVGLDDLLRALNGLYVAIGQLPLRIAEALQLPEPVVVSPPPPELPVPVVNVPPVDLKPVSEEIQRVLTQTTGVWTEALEKVTQALQRQRLQFNNVRVDDTGIVQRLDQLLEQNRVDTRFDYEGRTDDSPVYIGRAAPGTSTSEPTWAVMKLTWENAPNGKPRTVMIQTRTGAWDNRTGLGW